MTLRTGLLACVTFLLLAAPAGAVVGGSPQDPAAVPWYADVGICGGTLIAPDRVMTAAHCVRGRSLGSLGTGVEASTAPPSASRWPPAGSIATGRAASMTTSRSSCSTGRSRA